MDSAHTAPNRAVDPAIPPHWQAASPAADPRLIEPLTDRERHFLDCLAIGASNKEIARLLQVSENTVKFHLKNVYSKFAVNTRSQAVRAALELGVLNSADAEMLNAAGLPS